VNVAKEKKLTTSAPPGREALRLVAPEGAVLEAALEFINATHW